MRLYKYLWIGVTVLLVFLYFLMEYRQGEQVSWIPSFYSGNTNAYGISILAELAEDIFPNEAVTFSDRPLYELIRDLEGEEELANLVIISSALEDVGGPADLTIDPYDTKLLLDYVSKGSNLFIAAERIDGPLADSLELLYRRDRFNRLALVTGSVSDTSHVAARFSASNLQREFPIVKAFVRTSFYETDEIGCDVVSQTDKDEEDSVEETMIMIRKELGAGTIFVTTAPYAFTNYALSQPRDARWAQAALSHLPVRKTVFSEYFRPNAGRFASTPLRFILMNRGLRSAWFVGILSLLLFIFVRARRRQRAVPIVEPPRNETLVFVETVGRLYHQRRDNADLARKKLSYLGDFLRSNVRMKNTGRLNSETARNLDVKSVAQKSGAPESVVETMVQAILRFDGKHISQKDLLELSKAIDTFYQASTK